MLKSSFFLVLLSTGPACENDGGTIVNGVGFYWEQTKCSDPRNNTEADSNSRVTLSITEYLEENGVSNAGIIDFENTLSDGELTCDACHCPTGIRILLGVVANESGGMEELGFTKL
ncbi:MAG: hypothetical protein CR994_04495 [Maribacter sp.]|nr:MAG: hypothetical protein CR994_04495 [Maribacter sp.]